MPRVEFAGVAKSTWNNQPLTWVKVDVFSWPGCQRPAKIRLCPQAADASAKVRGNQAVGIAQAGGRDDKADGVGGPAGEHRPAIERKSSHPGEGC